MNNPEDQDSSKLYVVDRIEQPLCRINAVMHDDADYQSRYTVHRMHTFFHGDARIGIGIGIGVGIGISADISHDAAGRERRPCCRQRSDRTTRTTVVKGKGIQVQCSEINVQCSVFNVHRESVEE